VSVTVPFGVPEDPATVVLTVSALLAEVVLDAGVTVIDEVVCVSVRAAFADPVA
jgi:hypothetical protein